MIFATENTENTENLLKNDWRLEIFSVNSVLSVANEF
jgi:hypothetical protein